MLPTLLQAPVLAQPIGGDDMDKSRSGRERGSRNAPTELDMDRYGQPSGDRRLP